LIATLGRQSSRDDKYTLLTRKPEKLKQPNPGGRAIPADSNFSGFRVSRIYKQTWGNIRKLADAPQVTRHLSFKTQEYKAPS
jgi:hypothetical protein